MEIAVIAAMLLQGRFDAEPHQIKRAVEAAKLIVAEVKASETGAPAAPPAELAAPAD